MPRKPFIAGNWKMHNTIEQTKTLAAAVKAAANPNNAEVMIAPVFTALSAAAQALKGSDIILSAQDCFFEEKGAFTSQISAGQVKDAGCTHVILGHSERRALFGDSDEIINKKIKAAVKQGLKVVFCIGETLAEREENRTMTVLTRQIEAGLDGLSKEDLKDLIVAYEPVWAIGTGKTATPAMAQETHCQIRALLSAKFTAPFAGAVRILYGGSVKADNVDALMAQADIDGVLVGGQSLEAQNFARIIGYQK
ncbi:MAG: triose-phosphate isomerase [Elusimicrobiota bacterium]|jgi:triosephosphate isomerase|nr:triose-phosphate isomerase [Elusimicrobiota bacterium]